MLRAGVAALALFTLCLPLASRPGPAGCGTHRDAVIEALALHRSSARALSLQRTRQSAATPRPASVARDVGNIAILEDSDGAISRLNQFNLSGKTLRFTPAAASAARYRYSLLDSAYDEAAASAGTALQGIGDDDSREVSLPFAFPFFGASYRKLFVNSDGNLSFNSGDVNITDRSLGRMVAGEPRIAVVFDDLDPTSGSGTIRVLAEPGRFLVTWRGVPEFDRANSELTFQAALYPDGRIDLSYQRAFPAKAVVGIAPGSLLGKTSVVSFRNDPSAEYAGAVAERFSDSLELDTVTIAQKFFQTHEDAYDYLAIFNNMDVPVGSSAVALETTVRNHRTGIGDELTDRGREFGSASRLQAILNLGPLSQYPRDPFATVPARRAAGDTPITIAAHEAGHLFLAFASARVPNDPVARPMLGYQSAHWSFLFNSEASLLEGERILDRGPSATPRFLTTDTVQGYAPLDQYLMGLRPPSEVPPTFYVTGPPAYLANLHPQRNFSFDGQRVDVTVDDVIRAEGRRIPDHTVAQRHFRFAFILLVAEGKEPSADDLARVEAYRAQFEPFFTGAADRRATADASLKRSLKLSLYPAAGIVRGATATATITLATAPAAPLPVVLDADRQFARFPVGVTIAAGATSATFTVEGLRDGVEELTAIPRDSAYETARARVQVLPLSSLRLEAVSGDRQTGVSGAALPDPVVVRLTDDNRLPYPNVRLTATTSSGALATTSAITDANGQAAFRWTLGDAPVSQLRVAAEATGPVLTFNAGTAAAVAASAINFASGAAGLTPGAFGAVTGVNLTGGATATAPLPWPDTLAGVQVLLNGRALPLLAAADHRIDFYVPQDVPTGSASLTVKGAQSSTAALTVDVHDVMPGVFPTVLRAGTADSAFSNPVRVGDIVEIYCTGLGPVRTDSKTRQTVYQPVVYIGGIASIVSYSGQTSIPGLYQINAEIPFGIATGAVPVSVRVAAVGSNEVQINVTP